MNYYQIRFTVSDEQLKDILIALLSEAGYESFMEENVDILAFIKKDLFDEQELNRILKQYHVSDYSIDEIVEKNWNKLWEQNFKPVIIRDECLVKAPFHAPGKKYPLEIIIEPQMSFGTAHHDTTALMLEMMLDIDFKGKNVLDMGSGTGILAIMAAKKAASGVWAIDNNVWAYTNSMHNIELNNLKGIVVIEGEKDSIPNIRFDVILANINRNVLLEDIPAYADHLVPSGIMLLSGILSGDLEKIAQKCKENGLYLADKLQKNDWVAASFLK